MGFCAELLENESVCFFFKRGNEMHIRDEVFAFTRAYEHLLASGFALTEDERSLLQVLLPRNGSTLRSVVGCKSDSAFTHLSDFRTAWKHRYKSTHLTGY